MPKKAPIKPKPLYRRKPPKPEGVTGDECRVTRKEKSVGRESSRAETPQSEFRHPHLIAPAHFTLREDGNIVPTVDSGHRTVDSTSPRLVFSSDTPFLRLYHGNSLELLDAIAAKYPDGRFDAIFADPPAWP